VACYRLGIAVQEGTGAAPSSIQNGLRLLK
jgi:hypothetical protein